MKKYWYQVIGRAFSLSLSFRKRPIFNIDSKRASYPCKKKFAIFINFKFSKKITIFHNILNIRRLCVDCIRHFQRATSQGYIISIGHRKLASYSSLLTLHWFYSFRLLGKQAFDHLQFNIAFYMKNGRKFDI